MSRELTRQAFEARLEELRRLTKDEGKFSQLAERLSEKGVECTIITPLIEMVLEFDPVLDVRYEEPSEIRNGQRFDFLLDDRFLIEVKRLGADLEGAHGQIELYLGTNPKLECGILTNGIDYEVFLRKDFIEHHVNSKFKRFHKPVVQVLDLSLAEQETDDVLNGLSILRKDQCHQRVRKMAAIAFRYIEGGSGALGVLHEVKKTDELLKDRIRAAVEVRRGVYAPDLDTKTRKVGEKLRYKNDWIEITVEITPTGSVILKKGSAIATFCQEALDAGWGPIFDVLRDSWSKEDMEFTDPLEIIKKARGMQRLQKQHLYPFVPVS